MIILMFSLDEWIVSPEQACVWLIASVTATSVRYSQSEGITTIPKGPKPQPSKDVTMSCHFIHLNIHINMKKYMYIYIYTYVYIYIYIYINDMVFKSAAPTQHPSRSRTQNFTTTKKGRWAANPLNKVTLPTVDS